MLTERICKTRTEIWPLDLVMWTSLMTLTGGQPFRTGFRREREEKKLSRSFALKAEREEEVGQGEPSPFPLLPPLSLPPSQIVA